MFEGTLPINGVLARAKTEFNPSFRMAITFLRQACVNKRVLRVACSEQNLLAGPFCKLTADDGSIEQLEAGRVKVKSLRRVRLCSFTEKGETIRPGTNQDGMHQLGFLLLRSRDLSLVTRVEVPSCGLCMLLFCTGAPPNSCV